MRPDAKETVELTSVTRFPLAKTFKPSLWPKAKVELDGVATRLAMGLGAKQTEPVRTVGSGASSIRRVGLSWAAATRWSSTRTVPR